MNHKIWIIIIFIISSCQLTPDQEYIIPDIYSNFNSIEVTTYINLDNEMSIYAKNISNNLVIEIDYNINNINYQKYEIIVPNNKIKLVSYLDPYICNKIEILSVVEY